MEPYSNFDPHMVGRRIQDERKRLGFKNTDAFCNANPIFKVSSMKKWESGYNDEISIESLINLCNVFECELDYLLGKQECRTKSATDICKETGLSEKALKSIIKCNDLFQSNEWVSINLLNFLLESNKIIDLLFILSNELYAKMNYSSWFDHLNSEVKELLRTIFQEASSNAFIISFEPERTQKEEFATLLYQFFEEYSSAELLEAFQPIFNYPNEEKTLLFISKNKDKPREDILKMIVKEIIHYSYNYLVYESKQKERFFNISDSFLDLIKSYLKKCEEIE